MRTNRMRLFLAFAVALVVTAAAGAVAAQDRGAWPTKAATVDAVEPAVDDAQQKDAATLKALSDWELALAVIAELEVPARSEVVVMGPVPAGSWLVEMAADVEVDYALPTPGEKGTWYAVWVDPLAGSAFDHPTVMGWIRAEDGLSALQPARQRVHVLTPAGDIQGFAEEVLGESDGVTISRGFPVDTPEILADPKPDDGPVVGERLPGKLAPAPVGCQKVAIVFDAGDHDDALYIEPLSARSSGREFFRLANNMEADLKGRGYTVHRYSNFIDTYATLLASSTYDYDRYEDGAALPSLTPEGLNAALYGQIEALDQIPTGDGCCHELLVYLVGHGKVQSGPLDSIPWMLHIFPGDSTHQGPVIGANGAVLDSGSASWSILDLSLPLATGTTQLAASGKVKLTVFIESCGAGGFVNPSTAPAVSSSLCPLLCGMELYATSDAANPTMINAGLAFTDHFLKTSPKLSLAQRWAAAANYISSLDWEATAQSTGVEVLYGTPQHKILCP